MVKWYHEGLQPRSCGAILSRPRFMYYVYILKSLKDQRLYIGFTSNIELRHKEHCDGLVKSTKNRRPLELIYYEAYKRKKDAQNRENYLKGGGKAHNTLKEQIKNSLGL